MVNETILDESQKTVLLELPKHDALSIFGAPGTGKTYTLRATVKHFLRRQPDAQIAVLTMNRRSASRLRNQLSLDLGGLTAGVQVRSTLAFAFNIVGQYAQMIGRRPPELITGPDQDAILKEAFDIALSRLPSALDLTLTGIKDISPELIALPAFRADFRDLLTRAAELQLSAADLRQLSARYQIPVWELGAQLLETYENMLAVSAGVAHAHPDQVDHARLLTLAARDLQQWREIEELDGRGLRLQKESSWDLVLVDDVQNAPLSLLDLLRELQLSGAKIVTFGDPDLAVEGYRGAVAYLPMFFTRSKTQNGLGAKRLNLSVSYRLAGSMGLCAAKIQTAIHTAGGGSHRKAINDHLQNCVLASPELRENTFAGTFASERSQIAYIANEFKRLHLAEGISYGQMAVITRSAAEHTRLRRLFEEFNVNVEAAVATAPLRKSPLVRELLSIIARSIEFPSQELFITISDLLSGRLFGYSPALIRKIIGELHGWELFAGGKRSGKEVLESLAADPRAEIYQKIPELQKLARIIAVIKEVDSQRLNLQEALWEIWDALQIAQLWQARALADGLLAVQANDGLDAMLQLFRFAQRLAEREGNGASLRRLLTLLEVQDLPEDSIAKPDIAAEQVVLTTAASALGRSWAYVAVVNLNDQHWPNVKLRNPLTHVPELSAIVIRTLVSGNEALDLNLSSEVIDDELRMFLAAVTRASKKLYLTAVESEESSASAFLKLVSRKMPEQKQNLAQQEASQEAAKVKQEPCQEAASELLLVTEAEKNSETPSFDLPILQHFPNDIKVISYENELGNLRIVARYAPAPMREKAQGLITQILAANRAQNNILEFPQWIDQLEISTDTEIEGKAAISPSRVEKYLDCPLLAFYDQIGARADDPQMCAAQLGSLVHKIIELYPNGGLENMKTALKELWGEYIPDLENRISVKLTHDAVQMLENYDHYAKETAELEKFSELSAKFQSTNYDVYARIDRIERDLENPERAVVVDFKTGKTPISYMKAQVNPQLRVYQWLIHRGCIQLADGRKINCSAGAKLLYLRKKSAVREQKALAEKEIQEVEKDLLQVAKRIKGPHFLAQYESESCARCVFKELCPAYFGKRVFS